MVYRSSLTTITTKLAVTLYHNLEKADPEQRILKIGDAEKIGSQIPNPKRRAFFHVEFFYGNTFNRGAFQVVPKLVLDVVKHPDTSYGPLYIRLKQLPEPEGGKFAQAIWEGITASQKKMLGLKKPGEWLVKMQNDLADYTNEESIKSGETATILGDMEDLSIIMKNPGLKKSFETKLSPKTRAIWEQIKDDPAKIQRWSEKESRKRFQTNIREQLAEMKKELRFVKHIHQIMKKPVRDLTFKIDLENCALTIPL